MLRSRLGVLLMSDAAISVTPTLSRRLASEALGTATLLATVVGSGVMGDRLAGGNVAVALLANTLSTGAGLVALILTFGGISGAHFNPAVTLVEMLRAKLSPREAIAYISAQTLGGIVGVVIAHLMFELPAISISLHARAGASQALSETVATFGLIATILGTSARRPGAVPFAVGAYITSAYWFTSSTSFANPAVTIARSLINTFAGIRPADVPMFIGAQLVGAALAAMTFRWFEREAR